MHTRGVALTLAPLMALALLAGGCGTGGGAGGVGVPAGQQDPGASAPASPGTPSGSGTSGTGTSDSDNVPVREGHPARPSAAFVPEKITLPGRQSAAVVPAQTVDGVLAVPENVQKVGWWDGSAEINDPFGSTVIAGHVDSATQGLGFFSRLLQLRTGEKITVSAGSGHRAGYVITSVRSVLKGALSSDSAAFDQNGDHRLVLITCTGAYIKSQGGYQSNLVIIARPVG